ncbi:TetR/AcrR family transcriptional regulator [Vannielia litorea]|uniref:TetR/AcrR family transcriptional regulator n=1 Tax=Vannielia TaxID=2813041 RepID=UPI001C947AEA|nr:TetR/AcrR family transcriptional regulator [Vannielia litorea]MBY6050004.1 TetR/AcrR family transcriptional regulator [Vannielia litorea]MBY6077418.1 TetR/AcrR family transcriptional regulator [Vannielia litorea]MBY6155351.1 TetR/AcrR family transcriptional regulator [Vannielia litorea]
MNAPMGEIKRGRKFDQVLEGARKIFLADGFEGASVDLIAKEAGVSKATLYSYFPDKGLLFMEVATCECQRQAEAAVTEIDPSRPVRDVLRLVAERMQGFMLSDLGKGMFRICVAESGRFPELGQEFYKYGPRFVRDSIVPFLQNAQERGELAGIEDFELSAYQFMELCKAEVWVKCLMGLEDEFTEEKRKKVIDSAIDMFMARYGA